MQKCAHHTAAAHNALHGQRPPIARDATLWCINHIPANSPRYSGILPDKEVKSLGTIDCRKFSCCRLVNLPVQPTCVITFYSKEWFPRGKLLTNLTVHSERDRDKCCLSPPFTAESSVEVWFIPPTQAFACVALRAQ